MKKSLTLLSAFLFGLTVSSSAQTTTYNYVGSPQTYTVPAGVTAINVDAIGARGGQAGPFAPILLATTTPGCGGRVQATLAVTPGQVLTIKVGGFGLDGDGFTASVGGYNGGGNAASWPTVPPSQGGGGGGKTDVTIAGTTMVVAGGGGGAGYNGSPCTPTGDQPGANGGNTTGADAVTCDAYLITLGYTIIIHSGGGQPAAGGAGGALLPGTMYVPGSAGTLGTGGDNLPVTFPYTFGGGIGGGGGGGYYGGGGGCWMGGGGGSSYTIPGLATGVAHTQGYNCTAAPGGNGSLTICAPSPGTIIGTRSVCPGATTTLSDPTASAGGTWASNNLPVATIESSTGIVHGVATGTATITYSFSTPGCGSGYATTVVTVNPGPSAILGPRVVCSGSAITLTDAIGGGTWVSSNIPVASVGLATGVVTGGAVGTTLITYDNHCGAPVTATITVNPLPAVITGVTTLCQGAATTLSDATPSGTWSSVSTVVATVGSSTGVVTGASGGTATISYTIPNGCAATTTVNVIPPLAPITGPAKVCTGQTVTLGALPAGGTWSSSNTSVATVGSTGIVRGISFGLVEVTYTIGSGCSAVQFMTVNPIAPILGTDSVCQGLTSYLTNIVGGGIWSSTDLAVATVTFDSGKVSGLTTGTTTISYVLPTGCNSAATFSVIAFPTGITGSMSVCPGTSSTLHNTTAGGTWSTENAYVATVGSSNGTVTGVNANTVNISYTILPGCSVSAEITVNPLPAPITGRILYCPGNIDTLHDYDAGGSWSSGAPGMATIVDSSGVITAVAGGTPVITYTLPTGCIATKTLSVDPAPHPSIAYNWQTNSFYTDTIWEHYQWYDSISGVIPGANSPTLAAGYTEYFYVIVTDKNGCKGPSDTIFFNTRAVGLTNAASNNRVRIYPNPTTGIVHIESLAPVRLVISSIEGKMELQQAKAKEVDISGLATGMYFMSLYDESGQLITVQKLVKQ